jgi:hypothetical protein
MQDNERKKQTEKKATKTASNQKRKNERTEKATNRKPRRMFSQLSFQRATTIPFFQNAVCAAFISHKKFLTFPACVFCW